ncbi:Hypothetical protein SCF082_LOCUS36299, partial [Durusdinium trenchii]
MAFARLFEHPAGTTAAREIVREDENTLLVQGFRRNAESPESLRCRGLLPCRPWAMVSMAGVLLLGVLWRSHRSGDFQVFTFQDWEEELPKCEDFPKLDFLWVAHSNLDHKGPDMGEEGLVYRVRNYKGEHMEMVFNAVENFQAFDSKMFGLHGFYGSLNVAALSKAHLRVTFRDHETKKPVTMEAFAMTFYDIDQGFSNTGIEEVTIQGDWTVAIVSTHTGVHVEHSPHFRRIQFRSTLAGMAMDSPTDARILTEDQFHKAVTIRFNEVDAFQVSLGVLSTGAHHRFFEFLGEASLLCAHLPEGGPAPVGKAYWNPRKHAPPGLIPKRPFETVALTHEQWVFEGWEVKEEDPVVIGDAVLHGKHVVGADELRHDQTLRCTAKGTVRKVLPNVDVGETLLPDLGVAIIAFPIVRPPGLVERPQKYDFFVVTERTYRFNLFQVHPGEHVVMGQALFDGKPVIGEELGESVSIKANSSGHVEMVLETLHPNYFVLKDVAVMLIRPKVLWPPGIQAESPQDHILTTDRVLVFLEWKAHIDDEVSPGDPLMLAQDWGSGKPHVLHASVKGLLSHPRFMEKGQIIEMGVGVARITVEVTTTSYNASAAQIQGSEDSFNPFLWLSIGAGVVIG